MAKEALEQEPCEDCISRKAAIDAVRKNTFRLTFAEEQGCEGHVAWSAEAVYSDVIEGALLELPPVAPQPKTGRWIHNKCDKCGASRPPLFDNYCPNCGAKMEGMSE